MDKKKIAPLKERDITRHIAQAHFRDFEKVVVSDVIVIGGGPSGLVCARELAQSGHRVLLVEQMNPLGGGFWSGGYLMTKAAIAAPAHEYLVKLGVPVEKTETKDLYLVEAAHACSKLIGAAYDAGVKVLNLTKVVDLIVREKNRVEGVVVNWTPVEEMGHDVAHVDPIGLESKVVVDATGHDA